MPSRIIVLSGPVASGKTTLGDTLVTRYGFVRLKTRQLIHAMLGTEIEREALQKAGDRLDRKHKGRWVAQALSRALSNQPEDVVVLVDSVRIPGQVDAIRKSFGSRVVHVHLTAPPEVLADRYANRAGEIRELASYEEVRRNPTEKRVERLAKIADIVIDTGRCTDADVHARVAGHLGLYGRGVERLVDVLVGGQFGSEGKGHIASYLAPEYHVLLRVGGPNAGHTVYEEPKPYIFHHLPSGTRCSEAHLVLGPGATLWIPQLMKEIADCRISSQRLSIDPQAMIIEEADREFEAKSLKRSIGSTAQGVGHATARKILRRAADPPVRFARDIKEIRPFVRETRLVLDDAFARGQKVFLEGTQGTGLSLHHDSYPYVTSRDTAVSGCLAEAGIAPSRVRRIVLVCRTYPIRVQNPPRGTSGPMTIELEWDEISRRSGIPLEELLGAEVTSTTKRKRRVGEFDWTLLRRSASLNGPTDIAITFADYVSIENRAARRFEQLTPDTLRFIEEVERVAAAPASLIATRFQSRSIIDRRSW